jgi:hypothetical protein
MVFANNIRRIDRFSKSSSRKLKRKNVNSHVKYKREEKKLLKIISQLNYTGKIPTGVKIKDSLDKLRKLIISLEQRNKIIRQIQSFDTKIDVTVNFNKKQLGEILKFLKYQKNIKYKLIKAELGQKFGKQIIKKYQVKVNEIKFDPNSISILKEPSLFSKQPYDYNEKYNIDKAMDVLKEVEEKILNLDLEETISYRLIHRPDDNSKRLKLCKFLLKSDQEVTISKIKKNINLNTNLIALILYDLFGKSLVSGVRGVHENGKDFVDYWKPTIGLLSYVEELKKVIQEEIKIEKRDIKRYMEFANSGSAKYFIKKWC